MSDAARPCPACGAPAPASARYCPWCGRMLADSDSDAASAQDVTYTYSPPRLFGVASPTATFVVACVVLAGAIAAFVSGSVILGILLLAAAAAVFVLFYGAAERDPDGAPARAVLAARDRVRAGGSVAWESADAWLSAGRDVAKSRFALRTLRREREQAQLALGEAALLEDEKVIDATRTRIRELDDRIAEEERTRENALALARRRVEDERLVARRTEVLAPSEEEAKGGPPKNGGPPDDSG